MVTQPVVFIHIPKCAGNSIRLGLKNAGVYYVNIGHSTHDSSSCYKFTFVRNPYDRIVSHYTMFPRPNISFIQYVRWYMKRYPHARHMTTYVFDQATSQRKVDFVGRYENIQEDFDKLCDIMNVPNVKLPHVNKSRSREHQNYKKYYDEQTFNLVTEIFSSDLKRFNYTF